MLLIGPISMLLLLALYAALRQVDESVALIALALNLLSVGLIIICRPLVELVILSDHYAVAATDAAEKMRLLTAGDGLVAVTAMIAARPVFEIFTLFWVPVVGLMFLFLSMLGSVPWSILLGRDLFRLSKGK